MEHEYISASACDYKEIVGPDGEGLGIEGPEVQGLTRVFYCYKAPLQLYILIIKVWNCKAYGL